MIIKTEMEYQLVCKRIYELMHISEDAVEANSPEGEELILLSLLAENYEQENYAIGAPNPIAAIKFNMDQMNLKQSDIAPLLGGKTNASEVLNGEQPLTLEMIVLLNRYLGIS